MIDKNFFKSDFNKWLVAVLLLVGFFLIFISPSCDEIPEDGITVKFFYSPSCKFCAAQKEINSELMQEFPEVNFVYFDVSTQCGSTKFNEYSDSLGVEPRGRVPLTIIGESYFVGVIEKEHLASAIKGEVENYSPEEKESKFVFEIPFLGKTDLRTVSLPLLAAILGLIDDFNPCAMWVLVYLIGLVMSLNDKKRLWLIVGSFVFASGALYFLFMAAWLNAFLLIGYVRPVTIFIGLAALGGGILSVKEFIETKGALECKITGVEERQKTMGKMKELISSPLSIATVGGIIALAFVVNSIEFACSSAIPAVFTQVLAINNLSFWEHYGYIFVYDVFFMLDDLIIFSLAAFAISGSVGEKYAKYCKIIGGILMVAIGVILLFAPQFLI